MANSIGLKIRNALSGSIVIISLFAITLLFINQINSFNNQRIVETITTEYSIISLSSRLVSQFNEISRNPDNKQYIDNYNSIRTNLDLVFTTLDNQITNPESRILLKGLKNTVNQVTVECNTGISEIKNDNFLNYSNHFLKATTNNDFVRENTATLLQKEVEYLSQTQERSKNTYNISLILSSVLFIIIFLILIIFANKFSNQIILPIHQLTEVAKQVTQNEFNVQVSQHLLDRGDEIGVLSKSFSIMLDTIKSKIIELSELNEITNKSREELKESNESLVKLNSFMVNRELRMVELKEKVAALEKKLKIN